MATGHGHLVACFGITKPVLPLDLHGLMVFSGARQLHKKVGDYKLNKQKTNKVPTNFPHFDDLLMIMFKVTTLNRVTS